MKGRRSSGFLVTVLIGAGLGTVLFTPLALTLGSILGGYPHIGRIEDEILMGLTRPLFMISNGVRGHLLVSWASPSLSALAVGLGVLTVLRGTTMTLRVFGAVWATFGAAVLGQALFPGSARWPWIEGTLVDATTSASVALLIWGPLRRRAGTPGALWRSLPALAALALTDSPYRGRATQKSSSPPSENGVPSASP